MKQIKHTWMNVKSDNKFDNDDDDDDNGIMNF